MKSIDTTWPRFDPEIAELLDQVARDATWGNYDGPWTNRLEDELRGYFDVNFAALCCSGTFAVELALRAAKVTADDEVILAGYDFPGNFRAIEAIGATPVLVDLEPGQWSISISQLIDAVTDKTAAIIVSHLHGQLVDVADLRNQIDRDRVAIIEDICQCPGARIGNQLAGTIGDIGVLSFGGSKLLSAGRGGAIICNDERLDQRAKLVCQRGNHAFPMSQIQAVLLLPQLAKLDQRNQTRLHNARRLAEIFGKSARFNSLSQRQLTANSPVFYKLPLMLSRLENELARETIIDQFQRDAIPIDAGFRGFVKRSDRRCRRMGELPNARRASEATLLLHHPVLLATAAEIAELGERIIAVIESSG